MPERRNARDEDVEVGAYIAQDGRLYEITKADAVLVALENSSTGQRFSIQRSSVSAYKFVQGPELVEVPDYPPEPQPLQEAH